MKQQTAQLLTKCDIVVAEWIAHYTNTGPPALEVNGTEFARFGVDAIAELNDEIIVRANDTKI